MVLFVSLNFNKRWFLAFKLDCFFLELFNDDGDIEDDNASQAFGDHSPLLVSWKHDRFPVMYGLWNSILRHGGFISYVRCKVMTKVLHNVCHGTK